MKETLSERYQKVLVTVAMGFRTEEDIKKNGLYRFTKYDEKNLIAYVDDLFKKNKTVLALKIRPSGYRSEHINIKSEIDLNNFIKNLENIFGDNNEVWIVSSSAIECWRCRIYISSDGFNDMIEMAYSYDDHILDHIDFNECVLYARYKREGLNYKLLSTNLEDYKLVELNSIVYDIFNRFSNELKRVKEDLSFIGINGISLDVRINNGYDFHDFDVSYGDINKVIDYYIHK